MGPLKSISPLHGLEEREWVSGKWDGCDEVRSPGRQDGSWLLSETHLGNVGHGRN